MQTLKKKQLFAGKFEVQGEISKGQTGTIYYGYDMGLHQEVAIKIYHSHINGRVIRGKAFIEKSKPLLLIDHPNLIKIFKVEEDDDTPVVFMEFFDAPSLQQIIHDKGSLSVQDMLMLAREIAEVLVHTHFQGIIHGTLHPGHVLVGPQGQIKVMDLGLSWILMDIVSNCDEEVLRPLPYFPPEIAKGELLNVSSDLYSLGFMMYEMLTGTVPYAGLPKTSIMGKLAFDQADPAFNFLDSVPEAICDLIRQMTRNKTQERLQDATHVLTIINQQLSKLPVDKKSAFLPSASPQVQAPPPTKPAEALEETTSNSAQSQVSNSPRVAIQNETPIRRPQKLMDYNHANQQGISRKILIAISLMTLVGIAGSVGYWYRDLLEPHIPGLQKQSEFPLEQTSPPQVMPTAPDKSIPPVLNSQGLQPLTTNTANPPQAEPPTLIAPTPKALVPLAKSIPLSQKPEGQPNQSTNPQTSIPPAAKAVAPSAKTIPSSQGSGEPSKKATEQTTPLTLKGRQEAPVVPTLKTSASSQAPLPLEKQPTEIKPTVPAISPAPTPHMPQVAPDPESPPQDQPQTPISQKNVPTASAPLTEKIPQDQTDQEIEELLQSLDAPPVTTSPLPTAP
ncbi:MAG: protein kinase [Nitrospirota bacterium]|nr:protein kinase [Nitrospirota bacterium]